MLSDDPLQHLSRAAGLGAYTLLWLDMCLGVAIAGNLSAPLLPRWRISDLHQFTGMLAFGLLALHIAVLVGLQQHAFSVSELFIPLARQVNPLAPVLGITGLYLIALVAIISRARRLVGLRAWRVIHTLSFAAFVVSLAHAVVAGPDASVGWVRGLYISTVTVLVLLTLRRLRARTRVTARDRVLTIGR